MVIQDLLTLGSLTASINKLPPIPTKLGSMGLFSLMPLSTTHIMVDELEGKISLVPNSERGAPPQKSPNPKRKTRSFNATHLVQGRTILAEASQGVRAFGTEDQAETLADVINARLQDIKNSILVTREYQRIGAIKGKVVDSDGTTVIADMYSEFGVTQKVVNLALASNTDPRAKLMEARRASEKASGGVIMSGTKVLASAGFMDAFTGNAGVKKAYEGWQAAQENIGGDVRNGFNFGGVTFFEYVANVNGTDFIADGEAYLFPTMNGCFIETISPADYNETVNTLGKEFYAKSEPLPMGRGYEIEGQSNPLSICTRPGACIKMLAA